MLFCRVGGIFEAGGCAIQSYIVDISVCVCESLLSFSLPCLASSAPSASGSCCVAASSLAHLRWSGRTVVLWVFRREIGAVRLVIGRDLIEDNEGEEESTRSAARRRQNLECSISKCCNQAIGGSYMICRIGESREGVRVACLTELIRR